MYRPYLVDSGLISVSGTGLLAPLLYLAPASTADCNIIALACSVEVSGSAPTAVSNSDLYFSLNTVTGTKAAGAAVTPYVLARIEQQTAGASVPANLALAENNARVAAAVAAALA